MKLTIELFVKCYNFFVQLIRKGTVVTIPMKADGLLDEALISHIYIVADENGNAIYIIALTSCGVEIEPASDSLLAALLQFQKPITTLSLIDYVMHYHHSEALAALKKRVKYGI